MRLLTHNFLKSHTHSSTKSPSPLGLKITATQIEVTSSQFTPTAEKFIRHILPTLNWKVLCAAAKSLGLTALPDPLPGALKENTSFLEALHHLLINVEVVRGVLTCEGSGKEFSIEGGISNFMIEEEEAVNVRG